MQESKIYSRFRFLKFNTSTNKKKNDKLIKSIILIMLIAIITFYTIIKSINPIINELCINKAKNIATQISNEEATKIMDKYTYHDLITIAKDNYGNVKMIQTNTKNINQIMSDIPINIVNRFEEENNANIYFSLGSILGLKILSNIGPKINIKISNIGNVETKLESEFKAQGINQTLHRIYLTLNCEVTILTPYDTIKQKINNQVLIAESIIIGTVPDFFYNKEGL